jgi:hypothetical protein
MKFSEVFKIEKAKSQDWFDPILTLDTFLFIDPFLLYDLGTDEFKGTHDDVVTLFNHVFLLIAQTGGNSRHPLWRKAKNLLLFPEVEELCLGYADSGTRGSGSGEDVASLMAQAIWNAIRLGKKNLKYFEEVQLFNRGIGRDRISDAVAKIIRRRLATYTLRICKNFNVPTQPVVYPAGFFDAIDGRWKAMECSLPLNPYNNKPILLVPKKYLNTLPTINPDDFWGWSFNRDNQTLRQEFGEDITRSIDKGAILDLVAKHVDLEEDYVSDAAFWEAKPYDLEKDPRGVYSWYENTKSWVKENPLSGSINTQADIIKALDQMLVRFQFFVEENGGWALLWNDNDGSIKHEGAAQVLFLGIVKHFCIAADIDISKEPNIGRGPVDFKISKGYSARALIEIKKASNTKFWAGLEKQLPKYLEAEEVKYGCFLVVCYNELDFIRISEIQERVDALNAKLPYVMKIQIVDASRPLSASLLI